MWLFNNIQYSLTEEEISLEYYVLKFVFITAPHIEGEIAKLAYPRNLMYMLEYFW